jgi:hypothetical protein
MRLWQNVGLSGLAHASGTMVEEAYTAGGGGGEPVLVPLYLLRILSEIPL